jgi:hypothetical protein
MLKKCYERKNIKKCIIFQSLEIKIADAHLKKWKIWAPAAIFAQQDLRHSFLQQVH